MNYMDRNNVAAARLKGLEEDLGMTGGQFNTLVSVLYVGYVLAQIPSNMFLDRLTRPSVYISFCIFLWGVFSISTGAAQSFHAALVSRLFLGLSEAVFYPGILFMLSRWYKRDELGLRMAYFTCGSSIANAFGALTASGILSTMDNRLGYAAWRWLFFIEGSLTCILSAMAFYIVPDFPSTPVSWLTTEERMLAQQRLEEDLSGVERDSSKNRSGLVEAFTDWTVWWLAIALTALNASLSFGNFFPTLAATMGFGPTITLLLCAPPWIVGVATSFLVMRHSDTVEDRFWHITGPVSTGIIGFVLAISTINTAVRYLSLFFMTQATVSYIVLLAWVSNSIPEPSSKRAVAMAFVNATSAGLGNIGSSYLWLAAWGPSYAKSYLVCILMSLTTILMLWIYRQHLVRLNSKAECNERALGLPPGFRYFT
ncbi:MFS general substrate transporter [Scleroderma citrinum]